MAELLPDDVAVVDALDACFDGERLVDPPPGGRAVAFDDEFAALGGAPAHRREEFARGRICAHAAVAALGSPARPILLGPRREPRWAGGVVGSITHCPGYRAAAVAQAGRVLALGLDAEPDLPLPEAVAALALTDADRAASGTLRRFRNWERMAFSARESVFKAWFGVTGRWLDFGDVTVALLPDGASGGSFTATIGADGAGARELLRAAGSAVVQGRYGWSPPGTPRLVLTAVTLRHHPGVGTGEPTAPPRPGRSSPTVDDR